MQYFRMQKHKNCHKLNQKIVVIRIKNIPIHYHSAILHAYTIARKSKITERDSKSFETFKRELALSFTDCNSRPADRSASNYRNILRSEQHMRQCLSRGVRGTSIVRSV